ncbi:MAG: argininosuccinate lyase [Candidatus Eisenbacteria bacterium]|nr:argininosuccinate lyase [Candidatus Eisenbacteria bacterium]
MTDARPAVWAGRLAAGLDPRAKRLNDSLPVDRVLWPEELALTRAYAATLAECGVLSAAECGALVTAADDLESGLASGSEPLSGEDVHSAVEAGLEARCGEPARRLHTGRSRNDQVATLLRMRVMALAEQAVEDLRQLERALVAQAHAAGGLACAAHTHLQPAQPILLAHFWLAHVAAFERDEERFAAAREAADRMPLGSGAVAGTPLRYDRYALAQRLGFSRLATNSLDAVGDRDFALEYLNAAALLGLHLSRLAEDLVLACSPGFGWFAAPDGFSTGSSLLPQKRNPDLFELARGKSARFLANAQRLAVLLKGLPSAYQKDLQEDKEAVFDTAAHLDSLLEALTPAVAALRPIPERLAAGLTPDLLAVELADALVEDGVPFRDAHRAVGQLWAAAEARGAGPAELPPADRLAIHPGFTDERLGSLSVEAALARRSHAPGAGAGSVAEQLAHADARLGLGPGEALPATTDTTPHVRAPHPPTSSAPRHEDVRRVDGVVIRRAGVDDVPGIAAVMADYVAQGVLLPRPVSELFQCVREFWVAEDGGAVIATAALRLLWRDLGEVRSLAVRPDAHGRGLGAALVEAVVGDARSLGLPRVIALTREVEFFTRNGFVVVPRETLPRKVWTDCMKCPRRHACDEVAVALDLVPGASEEAARAARAYSLPMPQAAPTEGGLPIIS